MAQKARFFKASTQDGYGKHFSFYPAQSKDDLLNSLQFPTTVKLIALDHIGWFEVSTGSDEHIENVRFNTMIDGKNLFFDKGAIGYEYLWQLFAKKAAEEANFINTYDGPR